MRKLSLTILQPAFVFVPFVLLGFIVWLLLPGDYLRLRTKEQLNLVGFLYLLLWYIVVVLAAWLGKSLPVRLISIEIRKQTAFSFPFYTVVTTLAALGCLSLLSSIGELGGILAAIAEQQVNLLKKSLYENYSPGLLTFRYLTSVSAAIAIYNILSHRRATFVLDVANILMLIVVAFVSARFLIFQTMIFVLFMKVAAGHVEYKAHALRNLVSLALVCALLVGLTYWRSAGTYKRQLDINNPIAITLIEFSRYIAMPIQVTIGVANIASTTQLEELVEYQPLYLAPSFMHPQTLKQDNSGGVGKQWYYSHIDVPSTLTTNSVFAAAVGHLGHFAFIGLPLVVFLYSSLFYFVSRSRDIVLTLYCGVILYAFFELWRTLYFSAGSFFFFNIVFWGYATIGLVRGSLVIVPRKPLP